MWEFDCKESWAPKNWCFWTVVLEKTLESPLDGKEIQPVHSTGDQSWVFFGRNDAKINSNTLALSFLYSPTVMSIMTTGKTIALTRQTFVGKVLSLLFNMLSRLVIAFMPRSKRLLISWLQSPSAVILELPKIFCHCFHCFPIYLPWSDGTGCHDLSFLNVKF